MRYSERWAEAGIAPSVGSRGDSYGLFTDLSTAISAFMVAMGFSTTLAQGRDGSLYRTASEQACDVSPAS
jgi:hypothetical protein